MAYTKLNVVVALGNGSAANVTYTFAQSNVSLADAKTVIEQIKFNGGVFDDNDVWYPSSAIMRVSAA